MFSLNADERTQVSDFILARFEYADFRVFLLRQTEINIANKIPLGSTWEVAVPSVVFDMSRQYRIAPLILALEAHFPEEDLFKKLLLKYGCGYNTVDEEDNAIQTDALESLVNNDPMFDAHIFFSQFGKAKRCVCKIEFLLGEGREKSGTGFLVGPDSVITNYHVVAEAVEDKSLAKNINVVFDFFRNEDNVIHSGFSYTLKQDEPIPFSRAYCEHDAAGNPDLSQECDEPLLDYAILKLDTEVGNLPFGVKEASQERRGWIDLKAPERDSDYKEGKSIVILQHPNGQPMKLAIGLNKVMGHSPNMKRVRYGVNTQGGSSGSPVMNTRFELLALHNMGDPSFSATFNQGVVIARIIEDLKANGYRIELCQNPD